MGDSVKKYYELKEEAELIGEEEFDKLVESDKADLGASLEEQAKHTNWEEEYMDVITLFEKEYPELSEEYKRISEEMYEMFARKHMDYGLNNIALGGDLTNAEDKKFSLTGLAIRLTDKISRLKNLLINGKNYVKGEGMEDTFIDIANYGIIGLLVGRDKWKK
tara:strand:- start:4277 stop:4765 length:489 start_codon:yes stop_codon:yes gene_type:complete